MSSVAIRAQLKSRTEQAFGKRVWPHLFRDCAVTDLQTTKKYYIQAVGMQAHARVQKVIAARRRAAASGDVDA